MTVADITWYKSKDLSKLLGAAASTKSLCRRLAYGQHRRRLKEILPDANGFTHNQRNTLYITEKGLKRVIAGSHLPKAIKLAEALGCGIDTKIVRKEIAIVDFFQELLTALNVKHVRQKSVGKYKVDLYIVDYNLCIEIDEHAHQDRDAHEEVRREKFIRRALRSDFVRVNPDDPNFSMPKMIAQIMSRFHGRLA